MKNYTPDDGVLAALAHDAMERWPETLGHLREDCRIMYQYCDGEKTKKGQTVFADCERVKEKYRAFMPCDYVITFYLAARGLNREGAVRLMQHELMHIETDGSVHRIREHDLIVEDFRAMIDAYGTDWIEGREK
ncbi:MAG: hypothetical protein IKQ73_07450 [Oscillospiraceae bacterium]|nr:hypothetical protein [Oscillospiraceae bacterium]